MNTDHLTEWLLLRESVPWHRTRIVDDSPLTPIRDGAAHDIRVFDRARDPDRAAHLLTALAATRADAVAGPLTVARLCRWQRDVLGVADISLRTVPAHAKNGRERYGMRPDLSAELASCLAQSADSQPLAARVARTYLDVCFFHPFPDGNARSAFLAATFVLARAGIGLDQVGPIRRVARFADDAGGALALADLVATLIEHTRRRSASGPPGRRCGSPPG